MPGFHMPLDIIFSRTAFRLLEGGLAAGVGTVEQHQVTFSNFVPMFVPIVPMQVVGELEALCAPFALVRSLVPLPMLAESVVSIETPEESDTHFKSQGLAKVSRQSLHWRSLVLV